MFRRRSRGHYDPEQYRAGLPTRTPSLSASAAQNALRRHSLDQSAADDVRNFQYQPALTQPSFGSGTLAFSNNGARRNSLTGSRRNSLTSGRTNSMTSGRTNSLTSGRVVATPQRANSMSMHSPMQSPTGPAYLARRPSSAANSPQVTRVTYTPSGPRRVPSAGISRSIQPTSVPPLSRTASGRANSLSSYTPARSSAVYANRTNSLTSASQGRTNSMTSGSWSPASGQPRHAPQRNSVQRDAARVPAGNSRRNSLNAERTNSLTRTTTVVNRDAQGRTLSLTTTTVRQLGSFEIMTTKNTPVPHDSPPRQQSVTSPVRRGLQHLPRPQASFTDYDAPSIHSVDSELHGIEEVPEEAIERAHARFARIADEDDDLVEDHLVDEHLAQGPEFEEAEFEEFEGNGGHDEGFDEGKYDHGEFEKEFPEHGYEEAHDKVLNGEHEEQYYNEHQRGAAYADESLDFGLQPPVEDGNLVNDAIPEEENEIDGVSASTVSDVSESPQSRRSSRSHHSALASPVRHPPTPPKSQAALPKPVIHETPAHRETSPARSALRSGASTQSRSRVSFGGTEEPYVYESYEYEEDATPKQQQSSVPQTGPSPHLAAAAAAAARKRSTNNRPSSRLLNYQQQQQQQQHFAQPQNVQKRPSTSSLTGRSASTAASRAAETKRANTEKRETEEKREAEEKREELRAAEEKRQGAELPHPLAPANEAAWSSNEDFQDAEELPVPARSTARPTHSPILGHSEFPGSPSKVSLAAEQQPEVDPIRAQAIALARAQFSMQNGGSTASSTVGPISKPTSGSSYLAMPNGTSSYTNGNAAKIPMATSTADGSTQGVTSAAAAPGATHLYHGLMEDHGSLDDDANSVHSASSFTRERPQRRRGPSRVHSLRQASTPSMRANAPGKNAGGGSLLNQPTSNLDMSAMGGAPKPNTKTGFRRFSLRSQQPPSAEQLTQAPSPAQTPMPAQPPATNKAFTTSRNQAPPQQSGQGFTSRFADSDSEEESGAKGFFQKSFKKTPNSGAKKERSGGNGKLSFGDVFSPNTEVSVMFRNKNHGQAESDAGAYDQRQVSESSALSTDKRHKKGGFLKRVFGKKE